MYLTVEKIINETPDAVSIIFKKPGFFRSVRYKSGQFLTLKLPVENKIENRAYSLSSSPHAHNFLRITVKKVEGGLVSNYICDNLKEGQKIEVEKPTGNFFLQPSARKQRNIVLFAGGSGITPIYSILLSVLKKEPKSKITLIYANRNEDSIIFRKEITKLLNEYKASLTVVFLLSNSTNNLPEGYQVGRLNETLLDEIMAKQEIAYKEGLFMLCGPQGFMDTVVDILKSKRVAPENIKLEAFTVDLEKLKESSGDAVASEVVVKGVGGSDTIKVAVGETILQAAINQGVDIPYSCRSGMCSSCKAKCTSGAAKMMDGHLLSDAEVADGYILTCVAFPQTENLDIILPQ